MRRHFLFAREDAAEPSVGDAATDKSLLRLWLERREKLAEDPSVTSHFVFFWDLAKSPERGVLFQREYIYFFARVAAALIDSIRSAQVANQVAQRDWLYDSHGDACKYSAESSSGQASMQVQSYLSFEMFREALMEIAELLLPVESDASVFASFFLELRECIAFPPGLTASRDSDDDAPPSALSLEAATYALRDFRDIQKIRGAFLQSGPPSRDRLADIAGLPPPESRRMSLKQLLLCYNPRKLALSRAFSTLARLDHDRVDGIDTIDETGTTLNNSPKVTSSSENESLNIPLVSTRHLNFDSDDIWDSELAFIQSLESSPAPRIAVVGAPFTGKTRFAKLLAKKMRLRYLSSEISVQMAVDALRQRRGRQRSKLAVENANMEEESEPIEANDDTNAPDTELNEDPPLLDEHNVIIDPQEPEQPDPLADLFTDHDLNLLLSGLTLSREKAIGLLIYFARASLLAGVGVILDDVHPRELRGEIGIDFLVSLHSTKVDLRLRATGLQCAPTTRRLYSERELSLLRHTDTKKSDEDASLLANLGFADDLSDEDDFNSTNRLNNPIKAMKPLNDLETLEGEKNGVEALGEENPATPRLDDDSEASNLKPGILANDIVGLTEAPVPLRSLTAEFFNTRYQQYRERVKALETKHSSTLEEKWDIIPVLATQGLATGVRQCVEMICGNDLGVSRLNPSRRATPINLPDTLNPSVNPEGEATISRAEQMRCLLFGDWADAIDRANDEINGESLASLPIPPSDGEGQSIKSAIRWRRLSRWREFCPVTSVAEHRLVVGNPTSAATLAGRVYLFASSAAREEFCLHPLQYLRRDPSTFVSLPSKVWVLHRSSGDHFCQLLDKLQHSLRLTRVSATETLSTTSLSEELRSRLISGGTLSVKEMAQIVCTKLANDTHGKWILHDLPLTPDTLAELQASACLPDVIIAIDEPNENQENGIHNSLNGLRVKAFAEHLENSDQELPPLGLPLKRCSIYNILSDDGIEDALAKIHALINPLFPRADSETDGHVPTDQLNAPTPPIQPEDESTATLLSAILTPSATCTPISSLLGDSHRFCAVSWKKSGALVPGLPAYISSFRQRIYAFSGAAEQAAFEQNPLRYIPSTPSEVASLVPLVIIIGARGSGTRRITEALASKPREHYSTLTIDMPTFQRTVNRKRKLMSIRAETESSDDPDEEAKITIEALLNTLDAAKTGWRQNLHTQKESAVICLPGIPTVTRTSSSTSDELARTPDTILSCIDNDDDIDFSVPTQSILDTMLAAGMIPSLVIPLESSESVVVQRRVASWLRQEKEVRERSAQKKAATKRKPRARGPQTDEANEVGDEEEEEVDLETLQSEYAEKMASEFAADVEAVTAFLDTFRARGVEVVNGIDADGSIRQRVKRVEIAISNYVARKNSLFSPLYHLSTSSAGSASPEEDKTFLARLAGGELAVGKHGTRCPASKPDTITRIRTRDDLLSSAVVYQDRVYFPESASAWTTFQTGPWAFMSSALIPPPHPLACTVIGAPYTPTARLGRHLACVTGAIYVSPQSAIAWVSQCLGGTTLWNQLAAMKQAGIDAAQDESIVRAAIFARLQSADCLSRGWILCDYVLMPGEIERVDTDGDGNIIREVQVEPGLLFIVEDSFQSAWNRSQQSLTDSVAATTMDNLVAREKLAGEFSTWQHRRLDLISTWMRIYGDPLLQLLPMHEPTSCNTGFWNLLDRAQKYVERHLAVVRHHRFLHASKVRQNVTCSVRSVPRSLPALLTRAHSVFGSFCPVELSKGRYVGIPPSSRELCVDYGRMSFWLANEDNLKRFCEDPERYVGLEAIDHANELLEKAPVEASLLSLISVGDCDFPELKGYCPVTFAASAGDYSSDSKEGARASWKAIIKGSVFFRATYERKVFLMASEAARREFLKDPTRFIGLKLPVKLPPQVTVALSTNYPGRLEQILSAVLQDSLLTLGSVRPKFPGATTASSACVFLALILQQHGREVARKKHIEVNQEHSIEMIDDKDSDDDAVLAAFERDCQLAATLRRAVTPPSPSCGPAVRGIRGLLSSFSGSSLPALDSQTVEETFTGQTAEDVLEQAQQRFDAIAKCDETARYIFMEYATSNAARKRSQFGLK